MLRFVAHFAVIGALTTIPLGSCAHRDSYSRELRVGVAAHGIVRDADHWADWSCEAELFENSCRYLFDKDAEVKLLAVPSYGYAFLGWTGACTGSSTTCIVRMSDDRGAQARFTADPSATAYLEVSATSQGEGQIETTTSTFAGANETKTRRFTPGQVVRLRAVPNVGESFRGWTGACDDPAVGNVATNMECYLALIGRPLSVKALFTSRHAGRAAAPPAETTPKQWGVVEDASKHAEDGGAKVYADLATLGMTLNRWSLVWDGRNADGSTESAFIARSLAVKPSRIQIVLALYPDPAAFAKNADGTRQAPSADFVNGFCAWAGKVAERYRGRIDRFVVLNEPNLATFWPATDRARTVEQTLAACYDTIKAANSSAQVIGLGLSPRAPGATSTAPITLLGQIGEAYRASGRSAPLFDALAVHPYPPQDKSLGTTPAPTAPAASYSQTKTFFGIGSLKRVKDAVNAAFSGTGQKTVAQGLKLVVGEYGYQVNMQGDPRYTGTEASSTVPDQATQAADLTTAINRYLACDADVSDVLLFHLIDERALSAEAGGGGWQSGLEEVDGTHRQSFGAVQAAIPLGCTGQGTTYP